MDSRGMSPRYRGSVAAAMAVTRRRAVNVFADW